MSDAVATTPDQVGAHNEPVYFAVSPAKLVVMTVATFGLYEVYWFYCNWRLIRERERSNISPALRAYFSPFFCYSCLKRIRNSARSAGVAAPVPPALYTIAWIAFSCCLYLPAPYWLLTYVSSLCLVPNQMLANAINAQRAPGHDPNRKFSPLNITTVVIVGLLLILALIGTMLGSAPHH